MSGRSGSARTPARARATRRARAAPTAARSLTPAEAAWIAAVPCVLAVAALMVVAAPPLGRLMAPERAPRFFPSLQFLVRPEPTEHARYLLALLVPLLISGVVVARARAGRLRPDVTRWLVRATQALAAGVALAGLVVQHSLSFSPYGEPRFRVTYFSWPTVAVAAALAALAALALRREDVVAWIAARDGEHARGRTIAVAIAVVVTAAWMLCAINSDGSIGRANRAVTDNVAFWFDETYALLNGHAPLVDFHPQYSALWPYLSGGIMSLAGTSLGVFTTIMALASGLALLAIYDVLRRIVRSTPLALGLYLPFLATSLFTERGPLANRYSPVDAFSMFPMRYGGPYLLAWATARQMTRTSVRWRPLLFAAGGIVAINNAEFGVPALGATLAALAWTGGRRPRDLADLLGAAVLGVAGAVLLVSLLTLVVAGSLPHFGMLTEFPRLYALDGFGMLPLPRLGFHLAVYLTFVAAIVAATVRAAGGERDPLLTGMLAWAGVFGLGAGSYFAGRSHPEVLIDLFSAWSFALVLLVVVAVRAILARPTRRPGLAELAVLFGFGLAICSLPQTPTPWSQIARLGRTTRVPAFTRDARERFVARATRRGEPVLILAEGGHRIAYDVGVDNVAPYSNAESLPTVEALERWTRILREHGGSKLFITSADPAQGDRVRTIPTFGFKLVKVEPVSGLIEFVARR